MQHRFSTKPGRGRSASSSALAAMLLASALPAAALRAQEPPATGAGPAATSAALPPPAATDPLAEPRELVESAANTKANLKRAIALYQERLQDSSLPAAARANGWADASRAWLRLGDLESQESERVRCYTAGREAAKKGLAIDAQHVESLFWDMANLATTGRARGVMNSLFMLPELRRGLNRILQLDPHHQLAKQTLAEIDHAVPGIAGGSDERAEKAYREILQRDPRFTSTMANLAKLYRDQGKKDEARQWAKKLVGMTNPSNPNDFRKFDKAEGERVLAELGS